MRNVPRPENLFPWKTAPRRIYDALTCEGEVTNHRITRRLRVRYYRDVVEQIRDAVRPYGLTVARRNLTRGMWAYRLAVNENQLKEEEGKSCQRL